MENYFIRKINSMADICKAKKKNCSLNKAIFFSDFKWHPKKEKRIRE